MCLKGLSIVEQLDLVATSSSIVMARQVYTAAHRGVAAAYFKYIALGQSQR